jgi:hypothetical protein
MPKAKKYSRPGVERAVELVQCTNKNLWRNIHVRYAEMLEAKGGKELVESDHFCMNHLKDRMLQHKCITKEELLKIVQWKFLKGKPRHALMNLLKSNSETDVKDHTKSGMMFADDNNIDGAINEIAKLRGVGPATASAILSIFKPSLFAFMDDEVIECLYEGKRGYTTTIYRHINDECIKLANQLNSICKEDNCNDNDDEWNPHRVGMTLWTAARLRATGFDKDDKAESSSKRAPENINDSKKRPSKRRKAK